MIALVASLIAASASAADLRWEGFTRARLLHYDSLSLSDSNAAAEGPATRVDHRARLVPTWVLSERAELHAQLDVLAYTPFGQAADTVVDPVSGIARPAILSDGVAPATASVQATRAWGEVYTGVGRFSAGRMPMTWGAGLLWNPGNDVLSEFGDTADRVSWATRAGPVFVMAAADFVQSGRVNEADDMIGWTAAVASRSETSGIGLLNHVRTQSSRDWTSYTGDFWAFADLGSIRVETEVAATFGSGDLEEGIDDASVAAWGGMLDGAYRTDRWSAGLQAGLASGDSDTRDSALRTFTFDRDYNLSLLLFEEPLPTLRAPVAGTEGDGRTTDAAVVGEGVSNAMYLRPRVGFQALKSLALEAAWLTAMEATPRTTDAGRRGYGHEIDVTAKLTPYPHVELQATAGVLLPGAVFTEAQDATLGGGFDAPALAGRVVGSVAF
ncbi:MAG: hypothetical protein RLZZ299_1306 [Pseudomonadota bacterium]